MQSRVINNAIDPYLRYPQDGRRLLIIITRFIPIRSIRALLMFSRRPASPIEKRDQSSSEQINEMKAYKKALLATNNPITIIRVN